MDSLELVIWECDLMLIEEIFFNIINQNTCRSASKDTDFTLTHIHSELTSMTSLLCHALTPFLHGFCRLRASFTLLPHKFFTFKKYVFIWSRHNLTLQTLWLSTHKPPYLTKVFSYLICKKKLQKTYIIHAYNSMFCHNDCNFCTDWPP